MCALHEIFEWVAIEPSRNLHLVSASGHKRKHNGKQSVPMKVRDERKIWITFQVCEATGSMMSVGMGERSMRHVHDTRWYSQKGAMMENPPCEIMLQAQRCSPQSNGGAEWMVTNRTELDQSLQDPNWEEFRNHSQSRQFFARLVTTTRSMAIHAIPQTTRLNNHSIREDSTHVLRKPNLTRWRGSCVLTTRSTGQQIGISVARSCLDRT